MIKKERIIKKIEDNKEIQKGINKLNYFNTEDFYNSAIRYIKAIKQGRIICTIGSVSSSGMSRTIKFLECSKGTHNYNYLNFFAFFKALNFIEARNKNHYFSIGGCGMDMIFHTNYTIIHRLHRLGFISRKECDYLAQQTPSVI